MYPFVASRQSSGAGPARPGGQNRHLLARAPKLRDFGERAVAAVVKSLQTMAGPSTTVEGMLAGFDLDKARNFVAAHRPDAACGAIALNDLSCAILATCDATLVHVIVELLCGGNGIEPPPVVARTVTTIDQQFAQILFTLAASAIHTEWAEAGVGDARATKIEGLLNADVFGTRVEDVGVVNVTIGIFGLHGSLRLALPPAVLAKFAGESADNEVEITVQDPVWLNLLQQEVGRAPVALAAYLDAKDIPLGALAGLKVGQVLPLPVDARARASLVSDGRVLYRGELGQDDSRYSLRIDEIVSEPANVARMAARRASYFEESRV